MSSVGNQQNGQSQLSTGVMLSDFSDYLPTSQECVKPVKIDKSGGKEVDSIEVDNDQGKYVQINKDGTRQELEKTKIELSDCLACSGCLTSAETVLVNQQSTNEFISQVRAIQDRTQLGHQQNDGQDENIHYETCVISLSPQSCSSLAAYYGFESVDECREILAHIFKEYFGVSRVFDTTWSRQISHLEICQEFVERYRNQKQYLPMFASACPGWICYAEKSFPKVLPYIATSKSPQQVMGTIVKKYVAKELDMNDARKIYHVAIMPCFDKKLEASRPEFEQEVNLVLTSGEIVDLLKNEFSIENGEDLQSKFQSILKHIKTNKQNQAQQYQSNINEILPYEMLNDLKNANDGSVVTGSGGYCESIMRYAAREIFDIDLQGQQLQYKTRRNNDFREVSLTDPNDPEQKPLMTFAIANGFRNIQNIVRRMKRNKCPYDFIEVMACPSGCLNGGGQTRTADPSKTPLRYHLYKTQELYKSDLQQLNSKSEQYHLHDYQGTSIYNQIYQNFVQDNVNGAHNAQALFHTHYNAVENFQINPLSITW